MTGIEQPCDVLIPAAMENAIGAQNAERIKAHLVVEAANGPVTFEADKTLRSRGAVPVVMDGGRAQAPLVVKVVKESRHSERDRPTCSTAGVIRLRDDLAEEMQHNAPDEVAIASTRISGSIGAMSEQPIVR